MPHQKTSHEGWMSKICGVCTLKPKFSQKITPILQEMIKRNHYDKYDLDIHMITHKAPVEYCEIECAFCEQIFYTDSDYRLHVAANHTRINQKVQDKSVK